MGNNLSKNHCAIFFQTPGAVISSNRPEKPFIIDRPGRHVIQPPREATDPRESADGQTDGRTDGQTDGRPRTDRPTDSHYITSRCFQLLHSQYSNSIHIHTPYKYTDTLQVYSTQNTSPDTQMQVQTPKYKSRHPNMYTDTQIQVQTPQSKSRHPKYKSRHKKYKSRRHIKSRHPGKG